MTLFSITKIIYRNDTTVTHLEISTNWFQNQGSDFRLSRPSGLYKELLIFKVVSQNICYCGTKSLINVKKWVFCIEKKRYSAKGNMLTKHIVLPSKKNFNKSLNLYSKNDQSEHLLSLWYIYAIIINYLITVFMYSSSLLIWSLPPKATPLIWQDF